MHCKRNEVYVYLFIKMNNFVFMIIINILQSINDVEMTNISVYVNVSMCCMKHVGYLAKTKLGAAKLRGFD